MGQAGCCDGDRDADRTDKQGKQDDAGVVHAEEEEDCIAYEEEQDVSGDQPGNRLQEFGIFQGEGTVIADVGSDLPGQDKDNVAGDGGEPQEDHPGPVPGGEFGIAVDQVRADIRQDAEVDDQSADADCDDNGFQPEGKLFLVHSGYLPVRIGVRFGSIIQWANPKVNKNLSQYDKFQNAGRRGMDL